MRRCLARELESANAFRLVSQWCGFSPVLKSIDVVVNKGYSLGTNVDGQG